MDQPKNLYQKISAVMQDIQYLQKDDKVSTGASGSYKAMSEEKVTETVRKSLITNGLVILPVAQSHSRDELRDKEGVLKGYLSIVDTQYKIVDVDTGQFELLASSGTGADSQDKGVGKAMTYSYKYLLLRTFAIPTGDDPDLVSSAVLDQQHEAEKKLHTPPASPPQTFVRTQTPTTPTRTQQAPNNPQHAPAVEMASPAQKGKIRAMMKERGVGDERYRDMLNEQGVSSSNDLTKAMASAIIKKLDALEALPF